MQEDAGCLIPIVIFVFVPFPFSIVVFILWWMIF